MISDIKKEIKFNIRTGKILIIFAGVVFFAIATPMMTKYLVPQILLSEMPGMTRELMEEMIDFSQAGNISGYMGDLFQMIPVLIAFALGGVLASEIKDNTLVIPICSGKPFMYVLGSKFLVTGVILFTAPVAGVAVNYYYTGMLFAFETDFLKVLLAGMLYGLYYIFLLSLLLFFGTLIKSNVASGFLTLVSSFSLYFISDSFNFERFTPAGLLFQAQKSVSSAADTGEVLFSVLIALIFCSVLIFLSYIRLTGRDWNER